MHPHWQSTEDEQIVPVRSKAPARKPIRISRAPAAIVGIALMIGAVTYTFGDLGAVIGQLTSPTPDVTVRITQDGPVPESVTLMPGQTVRWVNDDQIPHVLSSETLPTTDGKLFATSAMFPESDAFYTVPVGTPGGTHTYISETSGDVAGDIVISATLVGASSSSSSVDATLPTPSSTSAGMQASSNAPVPLPTAPTSSVAPSPVGANVIAVNPYVVGAKKQSSSAKPGVTQHKPKSQTETGPAVWIVLACSVGALLVATRGAFRKV